MQLGFKRGTSTTADKRFFTEGGLSLVKTEYLLDKFCPVVDGGPMQERHIFRVHLVDIEAPFDEFHASLVDSVLSGPHNVKVLEVFGRGLLGRGPRLGHHRRGRVGGLRLSRVGLINAIVGLRGLKEKDKVCLDA